MKYTFGTLLLASAPEIGYGFQDDEVKSGAVLYSSVLFWNASRLMAEMADAAGDTALAVSNSTTDNVAHPACFVAVMQACFVAASSGH